MNIRAPLFAGSWYPADAGDCEAQIKAFLAEPGFSDAGKAAGVGGIVPHAGWYFSGALACRVIAALRGAPQDPQPEVIVIFGMHLHPRSSARIMAEGAWDTPLGPLVIETDLGRKLADKCSFTLETPSDFTQDNTIELQLPFIKYFFPTSRILPIGAPPAPETLKMANFLVDAANEAGKSLKIIGSTDLTHYGDNYGFAPAGRGQRAADWARNENDRKIIDLMMAMNPEGVMAEGLCRQNACCAGAAAAAIQASRRLGAEKAHLIGYRSSRDKHPGDSFVGYAGIVFSTYPQSQKA